jgi:hypothetical protein
MMRYVPSSAAEPLSQALWGLSRPPAVRGLNDTQYLFPWITALDGTRWLEVDTEYEINVHADAVLAGIADILQPWIHQGHLPADTNTNLAALVESLRGRRLVVYDAFPQLFKDMSKTHEEMIAAGLLADPQTPETP